MNFKHRFPSAIHALLESVLELSSEHQLERWQAQSRNQHQYLHLSCPTFIWLQRSFSSLIAQSENSVPVVQAATDWLGKQPGLCPIPLLLQEHLSQCSIYPSPWPSLREGAEEGTPMGFFPWCLPEAWCHRREKKGQWVLVRIIRGKTSLLCRVD